MMNKDTFLCFLEFFGRQFFFQKKMCIRDRSFDNLLGADADAARRAEVSLEQHVTQLSLIHI